MKELLNLTLLNNMSESMNRVNCNNGEQIFTSFFTISFFELIFSSRFRGCMRNGLIKQLYNILYSFFLYASIWIF